MLHWCIPYRPLELLISKRRKHFLPQCITEEGKWSGMTSEGFSSFQKTLNRIFSKLQSIEHLPCHLENFCIQTEERALPWEVFLIRNHYNLRIFSPLMCMTDDIRIFGVFLQFPSLLPNYDFLKSKTLVMCVILWNLTYSLIYSYNKQLCLTLYQALGIPEHSVHRCVFTGTEQENRIWL